MGKNSGELRHNNLVSQLEMRLFNTHDYEEFWKFLEYSRNGQVGEVDLLAMADNIFDFYEVKCRYTQKTRKKTGEQFDKYKLAFPEQDVRGFIYTGNRGLMRL